jgi:hypothetical protein
VHELIAVDEDADVRRAARHSVEEHEIARLQIVLRDLRSDLELLLDLARQREPDLREHPLREAAAVEALGIAAAVAVGRPPIAQCRVDQRLRGLWGRWGG